MNRPICPHDADLSWVDHLVFLFPCTAHFYDGKALERFLDRVFAPKTALEPGHPPTWWQTPVRPQRSRWFGRVRRFV